MTDPIIPDFGGPVVPAFAEPSTETASSAAAGAVSDAAARPSFGGSVATAGPRKLAIICSKGNLDMAYPGLILGNAALGEGIETHIFFTFWGFDMIHKKRMNNLQFTLAGNTAMHLTQAPWLPMPQILGIVPGMTTAATAMMKKQMADLDVPPVGEFLDLLSAMGAHMWACRLSFDMMKLRESDLYEGVEGIISATDFMELSEGAQLLFI